MCITCPRVAVPSHMASTHVRICEKGNPASSDSAQPMEFGRCFQSASSPHLLQSESIRRTTPHGRKRAKCQSRWRTWKTEPSGTYSCTNRCRNALVSLPTCRSRPGLGTGGSAFAVHVNRSRLERVVLLFKRKATHCEAIEFDNVDMTTLQAFYPWVYNRRNSLDGLDEEMDNGKFDADNTANHSPIVGTSRATASSQSLVVVDGRFGQRHDRRHSYW